MNRRDFLHAATGATGASLLLPATGCRTPRVITGPGTVIGQPGAEDTGNSILADGGNAFDAITAAALVGAVTQPHQTGVGGYCLHATLAVDGGRRVVCVDANSTAPAAITPDIFKPGADGKVPGRANEWGWLAAGVPGVIAGIALIVEKFGTRPFSSALAPAIRLTRDGFKLSASSAGAIRGAAAQLGNDPGSRALYLPDGKPPAAGDTFHNRDLAALLRTLADAESVEPFYRGGIARRIADAFQLNGGLVTATDLAAYRARLVAPLKLRWGPDTVHTGPLTSGGVTTIQTLALLHSLDWHRLPPGSERTRMQIEAMRLAWRDRLTRLGDTDFVADPTAKLLSRSYLSECASDVRAALKADRPLAHRVVPRDHDGTLSFSAADAQGNFAAVTLTHGNGFGARVTVPGLGLTLGHGMSRFETDPEHPNAPGPGKRPLHNMVPTVITRDGRARLAVGGRGGRKIPNSVLDFLLQHIALGSDFDASMRAPRIHTEGTLSVELEKPRTDAEGDVLKTAGYTVKSAAPATLSAVALGAGSLRRAMR